MHNGLLRENKGVLRNHIARSSCPHALIATPCPHPSVTLPTHPSFGIVYPATKLVAAQKKIFAAKNDVSFTKNGLFFTPKFHRIAAKIDRFVTERRSLGRRGRKH